MENIEFLLTDEYVKFSQKIAELHALKKSLKEDFKKKYAEYQEQLAGLDKQATDALVDFDKWKDIQSKKKSKDQEKQV